MGHTCQINMRNTWQHMVVLYTCLCAYMHIHMHVYVGLYVYDMYLCMYI